KCRRKSQEEENFVLRVEGVPWFCDFTLRFWFYTGAWTFSVLRIPTKDYSRSFCDQGNWDFHSPREIRIKQALIFCVVLPGSSGNRNKTKLPNKSRSLKKSEEQENGKE
ncbi:AAEL006046-PA, partial [Aedes aegypti]